MTASLIKQLKTSIKWPTVKLFAKRSLGYSLRALIILLVVYFLFYIWVQNYSQYQHHHFKQHPESPPQPFNLGPKIIVLWTEFFGTKDYIKPLNQSNCPVTNCIFTSNRTLTKRADALMFHLRDLNPKDLPFFRSDNQRWIMLHHESPVHTPSHIVKSMEGLFNWTVTYRLDSDVVLQTIFRPKLMNQTVELIPKDYSQNKTHLAAWFVSNCQTPGKREDFVKELMKRITVDVYGSCGPLRCVPKMSNKCYKQIEKSHRFYLSLENSFCKDYVTEKFYNILNLDMIPIVWGDPVDYQKIAPPKSFIDASKFSTPQELGRFLLNLAKNKREYNSYFEWKSHNQMIYEYYACSICKKLNDKSEPKKSWDHLYDWWFNQSNCKSWSPNNSNDDDVTSESDHQ